MDPQEKEAERKALVARHAELKARLVTAADPREQNRLRKDISRFEQHLARYHGKSSP